MIDLCDEQPLSFKRWVDLTADPDMRISTEIHTPTSEVDVGEIPRIYIKS
jgi:hypothetical protein